MDHPPSDVDLPRDEEAPADGPAREGAADARGSEPAAAVQPGDSADARGSDPAAAAQPGDSADAPADAAAAAQPAAPGPFAALGLDAVASAALDALGYEAPTPIQEATIPALLAGRDVLGQAQTGTGKTAAFALPLLQRLDLSRREPQLLVLTPTRELALQVAEACQRYAGRRPGFKVLPVYGGQPYPVQVKPLQRGVHVVVGTPGRVMDHIRRGTLSLGALSALVLDEADEMLAMGFLEDVTWILEHVPDEHQTALFSATMPPPLRRIADRHLKDPVTVTTEHGKRAAATVRQRHLVVKHTDKLDALTRLLEVEDIDGLLIFVRTKTATVELAEILASRGHAVGALNGDIAQALRERTVDQFKDGRLDLLVATDVAARGLDVDRISHVLNYDMPYGAEAYVHRIGRTGRAGRAGEAILFVTPRERRLLAHFERTLGQPIPALRPPSTGEVNARRIERFKERLDAARAEPDSDDFAALLADYLSERDTTALDVAAALARLVQGDEPLLLKDAPRRPRPERRPAASDEPHGAGGPRSRPERQTAGPAGRRGAERPGRPGDVGAAPRGPRAGAGGAHDPSARPSGAAERGARDGAREAGRVRQPERRPERGMDRYRVEVGHDHGLQPGLLVAAIAGESGLDGKLIGRIDIRDGYTLVDLPQGMPKEIYKALKKARICQQRLRISREGEGPPAS